jgi:hypothetical protein
VGITNFSGLEVAGVPTIGTGGLLPFTGNYYFVNEATGADGNSGAADAPLATLARAQALATANNNDVVFVTGTIHTASTIAWAKDKVHLIGLTAPSGNDRARISSTGTTVFTPMVNVTAQGCIIANIGTFYGYVDAVTQICWAEAGGRNYYKNVQFLGGGNATGAAQAGMRSLTVAGSGENVFDGCTIGLDTVVRATNANASLEFLSGTPRNKFYGCTFQMDSSLAGNLHFTVGSGGIDRYVLFQDCTFFNAINSGATTISVAATVNASAGGSVLLKNCTSVGATVYATTGPIYVDGAVPTGATSGLAVAAT